MQETFYRAYLHIEELQGDKVKPWLFTVAHRVLIDYKRKEKRVTPKEGAYFDLQCSKGELDEQLLVQERLEQTKAAIHKLPELQKQAIWLIGYYDFTHKEASRIMGVNTNHLRILLFRARKALRNMEEGYSEKSV